MGSEPRDALGSRGNIHWRGRSLGTDTPGRNSALWRQPNGSSDNSAGGHLVVGFDDVKYATLLSVPLTTIHQSARDIAVTAYRAMLDRIAEPTLPARMILLSPRLVVRESCGAYLPHRRRN